jgi:thiol-disulfide isomerase/thioredoxin
MDGTGVAGSTGAADSGQRRHRPRTLLTVAAAVLLGIAAVAVLTAAGKPARPHSSPRAAPNFALPELGHPGQRVSLAAYAGRPLIINFFASWCGPCKRETPLLASFYRAHHGKVLLIGVDSNDESPAALRFVTSAGVTYPVGSDAYPAPASISYGIIALPQTFMLNARHQIVEHIPGDVTQRELDAWASTLAGAGRE